jgi:hypothetical protein
LAKKTNKEATDYANLEEAKNFIQDKKDSKLGTG